MREYKYGVSSALGVLFFIYNPWTTNKVAHHYWLVLALASSYMLLSEIDKILKSPSGPSFGSIARLSVLIALISTQVQSLIIYAGLMLGLYLLIQAKFSGREIISWIIDWRIFLGFLTAVLLDSWSLLPQILTVFYGVSGPTGFQSYGKVIENVELLSRRASLTNAFRYSGSWLWGEPANPDYSILFMRMDLWEPLSLLSLLVLVLSLGTYFSFVRRHREQTSYAAYFSTLWVIGTVLSTGSKYPLIGDLYKAFFMEFPLGWVIRDPYKNTGLSVIAANFLYALLAGSLSHSRGHLDRGGGRSKSLTISIFLLMIASIVFLGWPAMTGNLNGHFERYLHPFPSDLNDTLNLVKAMPEAKDYEIFFLPMTGYHLTYSDIPQMSISSLNSFREIGESNGGFLNHLFNTSAAGDISSILEGLSVRYLVLRSDALEENGRKLVEKSKDFLRRSPFFNPLSEEGNFSLYEIRGARPVIYALSKIAYSTYLDTSMGLKLNGYTVYPYFEDMVIITNGPPKLPKVLLIYPRSDHHRPKNFWSTGMFGGGWLNNFFVYIDKLGVKSWSSDYSVVFTWTPYTLLTDDPQVSEQDIVHRIDFERPLKIEVKHPDILSIHLSPTAKHGKWSLLVTVSRGKGIPWKIISTDYLRVEPNRWYQVRAWVEGRDVVGLHGKIYYYDENKSYLGLDYLFLGRSGTFDWREFSVNVLTPQRTRYVKVQFWIRQNESSSSCYRIDDIRIYDLRRFTVPNILRVPLRVREDGNYILLVKAFVSKVGGALRISFNGRTFNLKTQDDTNKFRWIKIGSFQLRPGDYLIEMQALDGFNAVSEIALVPITIYETLGKILSDAEESSILLPIEAEGSLHFNGGLIMNDGNASNGECLLLLPGGMAWTDLKVPTTGDYILSLGIRGAFSVWIDDMQFFLSSQSISPKYIGPIKLEEGNHTLKVLFKSTYYEKSWNFRRREDLTAWLDRNFNRQFGANISYSVDEKGNLVVSLHGSTWGWKTLKSPLIQVNRSLIYRFSFKIRSINGSAIHLKISEYGSDGKIVRMYYKGWIGDGSFDWKEIKVEHKVSDSSVRYLSLEIWYGFMTPYPLPNVMELKDFRVIGYRTSCLDDIWIYSTDEGKMKRREDLFPPPLNITFRRISPIEWRVRVNSSGPFLLILAKQYDPLWTARVYSDSYTKEVPPIMVNNMINGFWIDERGDLRIDIVYKPYEWFLLGLTLSLLTLLASFLTFLLRSLRRLGITSPFM
ncbi:MAG: hypothetical protein QI197_08075 [Candidatus Korarchaeota archaeon]|nr:hypothetical protein [Candidatus Korarchaeota archaeon]